MDQSKIGGFIAARRRALGWTQSQLGGELGITDKAVSKWETGKSMPDLSLFEPLCALLGVNLNELLSGESIEAENLEEKSNALLMDVLSNWLGRDKWEAKAGAESPGSILALRGVTKVYKTGGASAAAVRNVSFEVPRGSFTGVMGASGSGKSTLLSLIGTIDKPTSGTIEIKGQNIAGISDRDLARFRRDHLGFVFQEYNLLDTLTIYENIALALTIREMPKEDVRRTVDGAAEKLGILPILRKFPYEVSGGERQRCACARAIASSPSLILADEPTGALDSRSAKQLLDTLVTLRDEHQATILMATHDAFSACYCDRILFMQDGAIQAVLVRGNETRQAFFTGILDVLARTAGEASYVS